MTKRLYAAALGLAMMAGSAQAATITNGSFEDSTFSGNWQGHNTGSTGINGWTVGGAGVDLINQYWQHADQDYSVDLSRGSAGSLSQLVTGLTIGETYTISFAMAGNLAGGNAVKGLTASFGMAASESFSFDTSGKTRANMGWEDKSFDFVAGATSGLLSFESNENNPYGPALDNISISAVPIPASGLLLLAGLGGLGALRRRKG